MAPFSCTREIYPTMFNGSYSGPNVLGPTPCDSGANHRNEITNKVFETYIRERNCSNGMYISRVFEALSGTPENFHFYSAAAVGKPDCTHYQVHSLIFMNQALLSILSNGWM